ncbi:NACHT, LRR and PYD domains-containing protein 3-like isoform X2 [Puntigrus tetrazona]|uniref:NACHT, LRR and PYD domains-containing protein 3-like isoform X2 n=1 Tax=Puntigrus tetrazona TaxID=1606681 RepID=UPI001C89E0FA|nr:NACHT, LRR and PYD domains-containing protein 3-like isoform X2 [Puntigrus tetrazona]
MDDTSTVNSIQKRSSQSDRSGVSLKSDQSKDPDINFKERKSFAESDKKDVPLYSSKKHKNAVFKMLKRTVISLVKNELKRFKKLLSPDYPQCSEVEEEEDEGQSGVRDAVLKLTLHVLRKMNQADLAYTLQTKLTPMSHQVLKSSLRAKYNRIHEGISLHGKTTFLHEIYTELYITEGESGGVSIQHEIRRIETTSWTPETLEAPIKCNDIFKSLTGQNKPTRTVLTKGVAGIGKTIAVQKFILDWAEGKENQDIHFIFPLPFKELNLMKEKNISLMELLNQFFTELRLQNCDEYTTMFILDGLDECRLPLDFQNNDILSNVTESASVDVLLTNLIKGNLLPSALLWITSRPAAANQIPPECVDQVTEVRGFNDPQKDEYFMKRISDQSLASRIITHIKSSRSLYIMCHIPVFCWISATVLQRMLREAESAEIPKTLTQMFTHFLIYQIKQRSQKYQDSTEVDLKQTTESIFSLGKLAFQQLEKGNLIFYEEDLRECGIDVKEVSVYSGLCTQIFREEFGLYLGKVYSFVHLSFQEYLAALFKFLSLILRPTKHFKLFSSTMTDLLKREVDRALESENGHLDLYLRFLLGLSLESNQCLIQGLLTHTGNVCLINTQKLIKHVKEKIKDNPSPEKSINLFHCLNELNDHSLVQEVQAYLKETGPRGLSGVKLSPAQWSALGFVLLNSEEELNEFKISKYDQSEECLLRLLPVVKASRKAELCDSNLTEKSCLALAPVISSNSSCLTKLDISNNNLLDSGVKLLCVGLKNPQCKLETLQLSNCCITEDGCAALASALRRNLSHLRKLNLSDNTIGNTGVNLLSDLLEDPQCKLSKLYLRNCSIGEEGCAAVASALTLNPSHLRVLNLGMNKPENSGLKMLFHLLENQNCKLEKLQLSESSIREAGFYLLVSALKSNPSHMRELDLSANEPGDAGVRVLSDLLKDPHCKLKTLQLSNCTIGEEGCASLALALRSNPSYLREFDISSNKPQDSGIKLLSDLLEDPQCKLQKLTLRNCSIEEKGCSALASALKSNPSHMREFDLSSNNPQDSGMKLVSSLLEDPQCKLEKLMLRNCSIEEEGCSALALALRSNPSHLRELDLSLNKPRNSVKLLSDLLEDTNCKLSLKL